MMLASGFVLSLLCLAPQVPPATSEDNADGTQYESLVYRDRVEPSGEQSRTQDVRVRLRSAAAVTQFGQLVAGYLDGYGEVLFEGVTIDKSDGRRIEVKDGVIEDLNPFGITDTSVSADLRFKRLTLPGLEPGDRLAYRIVVRQKPLAPGHAFGSLKLPVVLGNPLQVYELDLPRDSAIRVRLREDLGAAWKDVPAPPDRRVRRLDLKIEPPNADPTKLTKKMLQA